MNNLYLNVHFLEKDEVKSLGARWDHKLKKWYVPIGLDLAAFAKWLPQKCNLDNNINTIDHNNQNFALTTNNITQAESVALDFNKNPELATNNINKSALTLSELLQKVNQAIKQITPELEWIKAEVSECAVHQATGHCYLELVETNNGQLLSKAKAMIFKYDYPKLLENFSKITGDFLKPGMQILVLVKLNFSIQYGLSLYIKDLDPAYTIGNLAAKLAEIRLKLQQENIFHLNKQLNIPEDFTKVAILSPHAAAGLGDFQREAKLLQQYGLCQFHYYTAQFQGKEAEAEICNSWDKILQDHKIHNFEIIVIIRGGGAIIDLAWLNNYTIAKLVCQSPIPVFSGIGHERDNTIIDEIATKRFDTPSKVIAYIFSTIIKNAQTAQAHAAEIKNISINCYNNYNNDINTKLQQISTLIKLNIVQTKQLLQQSYKQLLINTDNLITLNRNWLTTQYCSMQQQLELKLKYLAEKLSEDYRSIILAIPKLQNNLENVLLNLSTEINAHIQHQHNYYAKLLCNLQQDLHVQITNIQQQKLLEIQEIIKNIISLGPKQTLLRGYVLVRDRFKQILTTKQQAKLQPSLYLEFHDGLIEVINNGE